MSIMVGEKSSLATVSSKAANLLQKIRICTHFEKFVCMKEQTEWKASSWRFQRVFWACGLNNRHAFDAAVAI